MCLSFSCIVTHYLLAHVMAYPTQNKLLSLIQHAILEMGLSVNTHSPSSAVVGLISNHCMCISFYICVYIYLYIYIYIQIDTCIYIYTYILLCTFVSDCMHLLTLLLLPCNVALRQLWPINYLSMYALLGSIKYFWTNHGFCNTHAWLYNKFGYLCSP